MKKYLFALAAVLLAACNDDNPLAPSTGGTPNANSNAGLVTQKKALYRTESSATDVQKVANLEKKVPDSWITPDGMHVTADFERYARPLIQAELTPIYINGVPRHIHL